MDKSKLKIFIISVLMLGLASCDDYLSVTPKGTGPVATFFETEENLNEAVTASYRQLMVDAWGRGIGSARIRSLFCGADDWTSQPGGNKGDWKQGDQLAISSSNTQISGSGWDMPYDVILQANFAIYGASELLSRGGDANAINSRVAEAYFLRAWSYFWLVRLYGDVPLITHFRYNSEKDNFVSRSSVSEVYTQILEDLQFAIDHLPESQLERARVTRWSAKALRATVYLTMASWPLKETSYFSNALMDAQDVIENGPYSLEDGFNDIFDLDREDINSEYIWQMKYCSSITCSNQGAFITPFASQSTKPSELGGFQDIFIEKAFFEKFPEGARKEHFFLKELISEDGSTIIPWQDFTWKHPFLSKFYNGTVDKYAPYEPQVGTTAPASDIDFPMLRITEMYLVYAEANAMGGGGSTSEALEYLNMIRRRAKGVDINVADVDDLVSFSQQDVIDERGWEFVGEMRRWFDLTRTETLAQALADRASDELPLIGDPSNHNLYYHPLPDLDLAINPNLTQNPR